MKRLSCIEGQVTAKKAVQKDGSLRVVFGVVRDILESIEKLSVRVRLRGTLGVSAGHVLHGWNLARKKKTNFDHKFKF